MKSYWKSLLFILITFTTTIASAQENCSNGTDDDGDGLIDCFDDGCSDDAACEDFFFGNTVICADEIDVTTFAIREQWGSEDESATSHVTPAIGDLDGNGIPEVISINNFGTLDLFVLNGATGATIASADIGFTPENAPIVAEIDGDEVGDIIVSQNKGDDLALYNVDITTGILTERWRERASVNQSIGLPGVADFDEDGDVEIYYRNEVMDALTGTVIIAGDGDWALDYTHGSIAVDVLPDAACADCAGLELVSGNEVWAINEAAGTRTLIEDMDDDIHDDIDPNLNYYPKYYPNWNDQWSTVSAADYNLDGNIDLIMTGALGTAAETYNGETTIFFWDVANQNVITYHDPTNNFVRGPGRVNIGDVDGDGQLNANFVMDQKLYSLDENFNIHWIHPIKEGSSGFTGCSLFDFDGDGAVEVVYRSEESILIIDGVGNGDNTTNERNEIACVSRTQEEYPVIADVDGDGSSEICVSCYTNNNTPFSPYSNTQFAQIRAYESDGEAWMPARGVWNQHGYYNVNINDDLTIPAEVQDHSVVFSTAGSCEYSDGSTIPFDNRPLNTFLNQAPILNEEGCVEFASPDIDFVGIVSATDAVCPDAEITVVFELTNIGDIPISGSLPVSYYFNDPRTSDGILLDTEVTLLEGFEVNETIQIEQTINGVGGNFTLFVVINDNGGTPPLTVPLPTSTVPECDTDNNIQSVEVGFQTFELQHEVLFDNRKCVDSYVDGTGTTINVPDNGEARVYYFGPTPGTNQTIWLENFEDRANGDQSDTEETAWTSDPGTESPSFYGVTTYNGSKMFNGNNTGGGFDVGVVTWTSEGIDISDFTNVNTRMDIFENGNQEGSGQWRDFVRISYELRDTLNQVTETGLFSNGFIVNDFDYQQAFLTNVNPAGGRLDSLLTITVEIHNTSSSEFHYIDNIQIDGTGPDIEGEFTEPDGFEFYWFDTADTDFSDTLNSTSTYAQMADGTYNVVGYFQTTECFSDTVEVEILRTTPTVYVWAYEESPLTQCDTPDGSVGAFVYTQTELGTFPANDTDNRPLDTLLVADGYEFNWRDNDDITNTYFATGNIVNNLLAREFAVDVIDLQTRCTNTALVEVSTDTETIQAPTIGVTHITTCGGSGELSASIAGNTADFTFEWYDGGGVKPAPDFTGAIYTVPTDGQYTLVVTSNGSGCQSDPVTRSVDDNSIAPDPTVTLVQNNTSCVAGNGIVSADGDGAGTVSGFTFEWFLGANTLASNALPGTAAPGAFLVSDNPYELGGLEEGTYTVRVTENSTSCFKTETVDVTDAPTPLTVTPGNLIQNDINSCDAAVLGSIDASGVVATSVTAISIGNLNSSFEELDILTNNNHIQSFDGGNIKTYQQDFINGWSTTASDQRIEVWHNNNSVSGSIHDSFHGDQFAEINANETAALYFDLATVPGSLFNWSFAHKGRAGTDEISVNIGAPGAEVIQNTFSTGNTAWAFYEGQYTVPTDQFTTRFQFEAVSTAGGNNSVGNFVDTVSFVLFPYRFELYEGATVSGTADFINTTGVFTDLNDGEYVLVVYDNLTGCGAVEIPVTITRSQALPVIATTVTDDANCDNDAGSVDVTSSMPSTEPSSYTYEIFDGHSFTSQIGADETIADGSTPFTFSGLAPGDYRIRVTNDDTQCTSFEDIVVDDITVVPAFSTAQTINDNTSCDPAAPNGFLSVTIQGDAESNYNFSWWIGTDTSGPADFGPTVGGNTFNGNSLSDLAAGDYTVIAENITSGCETVPLTLPVDDDPFIPTVTLLEVTPDTSCGEGNGELRAFATFDPDLACSECVTNYTFEWFYNGTAITTNGQNIGNNSNPLFSGTNGSTLSGLSGDLNNYSVTVTHNRLDCDATESIILSENEITPILTLASTQPNTICDPAGYDGEIAVNLEFNASNVANPSANGFTFRWFDASTNLISDGAPVSGSTTESIEGLGSGTYKVVAESTLECVSDTLFVNLGEALVLPTATEDATGTNDNTVCDPSLTSPSATFDGQITVTVGTGTAADYTFTWFNGTSTAPADVLNDDTNDGGGGTSAIAGTDTTWTGTSIILTNIPGGTYTLELNSTITGCSDTFEFDIIDDASTTTFQTATPTATPTPVTFCGTDNGAISTSIAVGSGSYTFRYYAGNSVNLGSELADGGSIAGATTNNITGLATGNYTVTVVDNATGCVSAPATTFVDNTPTLPTATEDATGTNDNTVCDPSLTSPSATFDGQITVTVGTGTAADYTFTWFNGTSTAPADVLNDDTNDGGGGTSAIAGTDTTWTGTSIILTNIPGGTYTLELNSTITGCSDTFEFDIIDDASTTTFQTATPTATPTPVTFCGTDNGAISTSIAVGSGSYTFRYYAGNSVNLGSELADGGSIAGATTNNITGLATGNYTVTVVDNATGCVSAPATTFVDNTPTLPTATEDATGTNDNTVCDPSLTSPSATFDGQITVTVGTGTAADYTFTWFNGTSTAPADVLNDDTNDGGGGTSAIAGTDTTWTGTSIILTNIPGGTYTLELNSTITGCSDTFEFDIIDDASTTTFQTATPTATPTPVTFCGTDNGAISTSIAVGSGSYTFRYYAGNSVNLGSELADGGSIAGATTNNITGLATGNYTVTVVDNATGCVSAPATTFVDNTPTLPTATEDATGTNDNTVCDPSLTSPSATFDGQITVTVGTGTAADYTFTWFNGTSTAPADVLNDDTNDGGGGTSAIAGTDTTWTGTSIILTNIPGGTYTLELNSTITGCSDTFEFDIIDDASTTTFQTATPTATPTPVTFCGTDNGAISTSIAVGSGSYTFRYYAGNSVNLGSELADGGSIAGATTNNITGLATGNYTVTVVDNATGCVSAPATTFVDNTPTLPTATEDATGTNDNTVCDPSLTSPSATFDGQITVTVGTGTAADYTFTWFNGTSTAPADVLNDDTNDGGGGTSAIAGTDTTWTGTSIILTNIPGGTYTLELNSTITGCSDTFEFDIIDDASTTTFQTATPTATPTPVTFCGTDNGAISTSIAVGSGSYTFRYYAGNSVNLGSELADGGSIAGATTNNITGLATGNYTVTVVDNATGCVSAPATTFVDNTPTLPTATEDATGTNDNTVCDPSLTSPSATFDGQITVTVGTGTAADYTFTWFNGTSTAPADVLNDDTNDGGGGTSAIAGTDTTWTGTSIILTNIPGGTYTLELNSTITGCSDTFEFDIIDDASTTTFQTATPTATPTPVTFCGTDNGAISTSIAVGSGSYTFRYYAGNSVNLGSELADGGSIAGATTNNITGLATGNYTVTVVDNATGCVSAPATTFVDNTPTLPTATEDATGTNDNTVCDPSLTSPSATFDGQITVTVGTGTAADYTFTWFNGTSTAPADVLNDDTNDGGGGTSAIAGTDTTWTGTSIILTNIPGGTYTLELNSTITGCSDTFEFDIIDNTANPSFTNPAVDIVSGAQTVCGNGTDAYPDGSITITEANIVGSGSYSYRYYFGGLVDENNRIDDADDIFTQKGTTAAGPAQNVAGSASNAISGLDAGTYTVVVLDLGSGCTSVEEVVTVDSTPSTPPLVVDTESDNSVCNFIIAGDYNGFIRLRTTDASDLSDYTYEWFLGQSTSAANAITGSQIPTADISTDGQLNEIPSGTYTVLVTDPATGCTLTIEETIDDDFTDIPIVGGSSIDNLNVCEGNAAYPNGGVNITLITGGSGNYGFEWYHGSTVNPANQLDNLDDIFTQKGIAGTAAVDVSGSATASISGLNPGNYTLRILDRDRGCYSAPSTFTVAEDPSGLSLAAFTNIIDNYSCNLAAPSGSATANGSGATTPRYEWYAGTSTTGGTVSVSQTATGLSGGTYTVKFIDDATNCFVTSQVEIFDFEVTLTPATSNITQTNCTPNGEVSVDNVVFGFTSPDAGAPASPRGYTGSLATLTYQWYFGLGTSTQINDGDDIGNGSDPLNAATSNMIQLAAGTYTVVVTDTESGCTSATATEIVADGISINAPDLDFNPILIPNACADVGSFEVRMLTNPSGNNFTFEFYEGAQDYANLNTLGDGLTTGDQLASNPGQNITVTALTENTFGGAYNNSLVDVVSGTYTVVVEDQSTGCRYQEFYNFPFLNQQTTTTITVENVDECPDNGVARVGLQEDGGNGFIDGEVDDISEYVLFLYAGTGIPADRESAYTFESIRFPLKYDAANGQILDGDDAVYLNAGEPTPVLNLDDNAEFHGLPAGPYIAVAREIPNPAFNVTSTAECWSEASFDQEIIDLAYEPLIDDVDLTPNSVCDEGTFGGNGQISVTVGEDPAENANAAEFQQPAGYAYSLRNSGGTQVDTIAATGNEAETFTTAGLDPDDYTVRVWRVFETFDIGFTPGVGTFIDGETVDFSGGDVGVITTGGVAAGTLNVYITTGGTPAALETITGRGSSATGTLNTIVAGATVTNGCSVQEVHTIADDPASHTVVNAATVDFNNCDALPASTITINDNDIEVDGAGQLASNYNYQWFKGTTANNISGTVGTTNSIDLSASGLTPIADTYFVVATSTVDGCVTPPFEIVINDNTVDIQVAVSVNTVDNSCIATDDDGSGIIDFSITSPTTGTYSFAWYTNAGLTVPVTGSATGISGTISGPYTGQLSGVNGGQNYFLEIIDTQDPNDACSTVSTIFLDEVIAPVELLSTDYTTQEDNSCATDNGFIEISSVNGVALTSGPANYTFRWYETSVIPANEITGSAINANSGEGNRIEDLSTNTYFVEVTEVSTSCVTITEVEIFIDEILANPTIVLANPITNNTFCVASGTGDGAIDIDVTFAGLSPANTDNFDFVWYRGDATNVGVAAQEISPTPGANAGTATLSGGEDLINLVADTYTVVVTDNTDPYNACESIAEFIIADDLPVFEIRLADITTTPDNNCGTANPNGTIDIAEVFVDGVAVDLATNGADYRFDWVGLNAGSTQVDNLSDNDEVTGVAPGTYTVSVTKLSTNQCSSATVSVTVEEQTVNPTIELVSLTDNTFCVASGTGDGAIDIDVTFAGLSPANTDNFDFVWYRGDATNVGVAAQEISPTPGANAGTATLSGGEDLINLVADTYTVVVTDNTDPYNACESIAEFIIADDLPVFEIRLADITTTPDNNCGTANPNGTIDIAEVFVDGAAVDLATNGADYRFDWVGLNAGSTQVDNLSDNDEVTGVAPGTYTVSVTKLSTNQCSSATVSVTVEEQTVNPTIELVSLTDNTFCVASGTGDGAIDIDVTFAGLSPANTDNFDFVWYRGDATNVGVAAQEISPTPGANAGTATLSGGEDLINLVADTYTVVVTDNTDPYNACESIAEFIIADDLPVFEIRLADITTTPDNNCGTANPNGTIDIAEVFVDGAAVDLATNGADYRFDWVGLNAGSTQVDNLSDNDEVTGVAPGTYTVSVTKLSTNQCSSATVSVTVEEQTVNPTIELVSLTDNTFCVASGSGDGAIDIDVTFAGLSPANTDNFDFVWYRGDATNVGVAAQEISPTPGANAGTATLSGGEDLINLVADTYTVVVTDNTDPYNACESIAEFIIADDLPVFEIRLADITTTPDNNCGTANPNGTIDIAEVFVDGVAVDLATNGADYRFDWVGLNAGSTQVDNLSDNDEVTGVAPGTYTVSVTKLSTNQCSSATVSVTVEEQTVNPTIELVSLTDNTFCVASGTGDGAIDIDVTFAGLSPANTDNFDFVWYRGDATNVGVAAQEISPTPGANAGTATLSGGEDLINLVADTYTVVVTDNTDPYNACESIAEFIIADDLPVFEIRLADITTTPDNNCGTANPNGTIDIAEVFVDGAAVDLATNGADYRFDWVGLNAGSTQVDNLSDNDEVTGVAPGTYTVSVTKLSTNQCSSATVSVTVEEQTVNPTIELVSLTDNTFCVASGSGDGAIDIDVTFAGLSPANTDNFDFVWYRGDATNVGVAAQEISPTPGANAGTATLSGGEDLINLVADTYTVVVTDNTDPYNACESIAEFIIADDLPVFEIRLADITTTPDNNCGTANPNGTIDIAEVFVDGVAVDLATNGADYRFDWVGLNAGSTQVDNLSDNDEVTGVAPGTYTVSVTKLSTNQCSSATVSVTVEEQTVNPTIELVSLTDNTFCVASGTGDGAIDIDVTFAGLSPANTDNFDFVWYRGDATNVGVAAQEISPTPGANAGTATLSGGEDLINLVADTYTVVVTDNTDPYNACESIAEFIIADDLPVFEIRLADITTTPDNNCGTANPNGTIDIAEVFVDGAAVDLATNGADYRFDWVGLNAGSTQVDNLSDNDEVTGVAPGTYTVSVTKLSTNQCSSATVSVTVEEQTVNPTIEFISSTASTFCSPATSGDGTIVIDVTFAGLNPTNTDDFDYVWYRGDVSSVGVAAQEIYPTPGANAGTAAINGVDEENLINLAADTYTVVVTDNADPYNSCESVATFTIDANVVTPTIDEVAIQARTAPDTLCTGNSGTLVIQDSDVSTGSLSDFEIQVLQGSATGAPLAGSPFVNPATPISFTNLAADDYYIIAENSTTGCIAATAIVNVKDSVRNPLVTLISMTPDEDCGGGVNAGSLEVLVNGQYDHTNQAFLTFLWEVAGGGAVGVTDNEATLSGVAAGDYQVTVRNTLTDCSITRTYTITNVPVNPSISDFTLTENNICDDDGNGAPADVGAFELLETTFDGNTLNQAAMTGFYQLEVYDNLADATAGNSGAQVADGDGDNTNFTHTALSANTYYAIVRKLDSDCYSEPLEFDIIDNVTRPLIAISLQEADSTCSAGGTANGTLRATATVGATSGIDDTDPDYTFEWYSGSGAIPANSLGITTSTISGLAAGTYTVEVERLSTGCISTEEFELPNVPTNVEIMTVDVVDATNCTPGNGSITVTGVNRDAVTDYDFDYYDTDPTVGSPTPIFTGNAGAAYTTAAAGVYYIIGTNTIVNCTTPVFEIEVGENLTFPAITLDSFDFQSNCDPSNPNGRLLVLADGQPENATYDFEWFFGVGTGDPLTSDDYTGGGNLTGESTNEVSGIAAGFSYTVQVTNNTTGCISIETFEMTDDIPNPIAISTSTSANTNCVNPNGIAAVSVISPAPGRSITDYSYHWFRGDIATVGTNPNPANEDYNGTLVEGLEAGQYVVYVIDQIDNFCQSEAVEVTIEDGTQDPVFELATNDVTVCFDEKDGFAVVSVQDLSTVNIEWFDDSDNPIGNASFLGSLDAGMYRLRLTDAITGCFIDEIFEIQNNAVIPNDPFVVVNNGRNNCQFANGSAIANVDGATNNFLFEWFDPNDMVNPYATGSEVFNLDTTTYLVRATNLATGCESAFTSVDIGYEVVDPVFEVIVDQSSCIRTEDGSTNQFTGSAIIAFEEFQLGSDYQWFNSQGDLVGNDSRLIDASPGDYSVTFTAENGCSYSANFTVNTTIEVYNGVSANNDGKNDFFLVDCIDFFAQQKVQIFNRDGVKVYEVDNYNNTSVRFEGISNVGGTLTLPAGTYYYVIDIGEENLIQGFLELVR